MLGVMWNTPMIRPLVLVCMINRVDQDCRAIAVVLHTVPNPWGNYNQHWALHPQPELDSEEE